MYTSPHVHWCHLREEGWSIQWLYRETLHSGCTLFCQNENTTSLYLLAMECWLPTNRGCEKRGDKTATWNKSLSASMLAKKQGCQNTIFCKILHNKLNLLTLGQHTQREHLLNTGIWLAICMVNMCQITCCHCCPSKIMQTPVRKVVSKPLKLTKHVQSTPGPSCSKAG